MHLSRKQNKTKQSKAKNQSSPPSFFTLFLNPPQEHLHLHHHHLSKAIRNPYTSPKPCMHEQPIQHGTSMDWFIRDRRGPQWKQGWRGQALASMSLPPAPLLAVFTIVVLFLSLSWYTNYKEQVRRTELSIRFFLLLFVLLFVIVLARLMFVDGRFIFRAPVPVQETGQRAGGSPWGVAALVVVLLLLVSYQSSFHSQWFRPLWRST